jgi:L-asparaginase
MKNILVVFTGGTIGSTATNGSIDTVSSAPFKLLDLFQQQDNKHQQVQFKTIQPIQILSENLAPCVWQTLIAAIEAEQPDRYDGIIVTHGTDTLAYTAAALSFYFNDIKIPLILVASDYPLDNSKANGLDNFSCAVEFILQKIQAGVFVPYRNQQQITHVHKGSRLTCSLQLSGDFFSVKGKSFMGFQESVFWLLAPPIKSIFGESSALLMDEIVSLKAKFSDRILMIKPYPGLNYGYFNLENIDVVLHDLYHSGTACASSQWGENHSLVEFIKRCTQKNITVYLAPAIKSNDAYQSTRALIEQGAEMIWNMSIEAAYVKLMLAYGNFTDKQQIREFIDADIAEEHV